MGVKTWVNLDLKQVSRLTFSSISQFINQSHPPSHSLESGQQINSVHHNRSKLTTFQLLPQINKKMVKEGNQPILSSVFIRIPTCLMLKQTFQRSQISKANLHSFLLNSESLAT